MKRLFSLLLIALLLACAHATAEGQPIEGDNQENFAALITVLVNAFEQPAPGDAQAIGDALEAIGAVSARDGEFARAIADHWRAVYLDGDYPLRVYRGGEVAEELRDSALANAGRHAFVVLGYALKDGGMTGELMARCDAAAAAARAFPDAILVCSGGATGENNPDRHTEAGRMRDYLVDECGIDAGRIRVDERAMTTLDNAVNTLAILQAEGIGTMTLVTSAYHQKWAQVLYNAEAALYRRDRGYSVSILENYCCEVEPERDAFRRGERIAAMQLGTLLGLPRDALDGIR